MFLCSGEKWSYKGPLPDSQGLGLTFWSLLLPRLPRWHSLYNRPYLDFSHYRLKFAAPHYRSGLSQWLSSKESACNARDHEMRVWFLDWDDPLEEDMATHSSILAGKIPWTKEPGRLQSMGSQRVKHDWSNLARITTWGMWTIATRRDVCSESRGISKNNPVWLEKYSAPSKGMQT